jgi:hypothetical protein
MPLFELYLGIFLTTVQLRKSMENLSQGWLKSVLWHLKVYFMMIPCFNLCILHVLPVTYMEISLFMASLKIFSVSVNQIFIFLFLSILLFLSEALNLCPCCLILVFSLTLRIGVRWPVGLRGNNAVWSGLYLLSYYFRILITTWIL